MAGTLYIVATPIGNLDDVTLRMYDTFCKVDFILCEDTRVTKKLLDHYQIDKPLISYHQHSDTRKIKEIAKLLEEEKNLALVTDAGTPGISDPGNELIQQLTMKKWSNESINIVPVPGPSAVTAALSISGFPTDKFLFLGFPPHKKGRQTFFKEAGNAIYTVVLYESGHRIKKCLAELAKVLEPDREVVVCRELTKKFETIYRGTIAEVSAQKIDERGEFVVAIGPTK